MHTMMKERTRINAVIEELKREHPAFSKVARSNYLIDKVQELENELQELYQAYEKYKARDIPYWWRKAVLRLRDEDRVKKKLKRARGELYFLWHEGKNKNQITRDIVDRALEYPIANLLEVNVTGFARCVSHEPDNHPSMLCKGNFAYCFACGYKGDVVDLYMKIHSCSFVEAVKNLASG